MFFSNLLVNTENYRFVTSASQKESIDKMISNQEEKSFNLADHILQHGLNPNDNVQVVASSHEKEKYITTKGDSDFYFVKQPDQFGNVKNLSHFVT